MAKEKWPTLKMNWEEADKVHAALFTAFDLNCNYVDEGTLVNNQGWSIHWDKKGIRIVVF